MVNTSEQNSEVGDDDVKRRCAGGDNPSSLRRVLDRIGVGLRPDDVTRLLSLIRVREAEGCDYDVADASLELLARRELRVVSDYFMLHSFRVMTERRWNSGGEPFTVSEATVKIEVAGQRVIGVSEGGGPVHAIDAALRKALLPYYDALTDMILTDFRVGIVDSRDGAAAVTRVLVESVDGAGNRWTTVGISPNVIEASFEALHDAILYKLSRDNVGPAEASDQRLSRA